MPMDPANYPPNWKEISQRVRFGRAGGRCECEGECGHYHHGYMRAAVWGCGTEFRSPDGRCEAFHGEPHPITGSKVVLTTAHLDQDSTCDDESRMRAMCQRCHLAYDREDRRDDLTKTKQGRDRWRARAEKAEDALEQSHCEANALMQDRDWWKARAEKAMADGMDAMELDRALQDYVTRAERAEEDAKRYEQALARQIEHTDDLEAECCRHLERIAYLEANRG